MDSHFPNKNGKQEANHTGGGQGGGTTFDPAQLPAGAPIFMQPAVPAPNMQQPTFQQPVMQQPMMQQPTFQQPNMNMQPTLEDIAEKLPEQLKPLFPEGFIEQSYIENILRDNLGKTANIYMWFEASQWGSKIFRGILEGAGKDHILLKDLQTENRYLLPTIYLSYITFDEEIEYNYPFRKKTK